MLSIKKTLMERDGMSAEDADELIAEAREQMQEYLMDGDILGAEDICQEYFGLEPDYLMELM
jgi:hypothetical protein